MMLAQRNAELNKKAVSDIVVTAILIVIIVFVVLIFWTATKRIISKSPEAKIDCISLINEILIEKACYLNEQEIMLGIKRGFDNTEIEKLRLVFYDYNQDSVIWEISGGKCLDVKLEGKKYGGYCDIVSSGNTYSYIFNMTGVEKLRKIRLGVEIKNELCNIGEMEIKDSC